MPHEDATECADALERAADREPRAQVAALLRLAAAMLREDDRAASERQTQFLAELDPLQLISVAALVLDQRGATGDENARASAVHLQAAGLMGQTCVSALVGRNVRADVPIRPHIRPACGVSAGRNTDSMPTHASKTCWRPLES